MHLRPEALSSDGFIIDQRKTDNIPFGAVTSDRNGCGWIAAYNLRKALDHGISFDEVRQELDDLHFLKVPGPTLMCVMRKYLKQYVPQYRETVGREEALAAYREAVEKEYRFFSFGDCMLIL